MHGLILGTSPLGQIVADYNNTIKKSFNITLGAYKTYPPRIDAIVRGLHLDRKKICIIGNLHQNRIPIAKKVKAITVLSPSTPPKNIKDFEDLYDWVYSLLKKNGVIQQPCLWVYDVALRIGQTMTPIIEPKKYVYLNGSGPFKAANILGLGKFIRKRKILYLDVIKKYPELGKLDAAELEDFLCIHRKQIEELKNKGLL